MSSERPTDDRDPSDARAGSTRRTFLQTTAAAAAGLVIGCGDDDGGSGPADAGSDLGPPADAGPPDAGPPDAVPELGPEDSGPPDLGRDGGPPPPPDSPEAVPESASFPLGVAAGDPTETNAVLWTRYDGAAPLELVVFEMDGDVYQREVTARSATPADGGFVQLDVDGLMPGGSYRYAFFEGEGGSRAARSRIGRFRTVAAAGTLETLLLGACSCTNNPRPFDTIERASERDDLAAFLLLGDTTYNDAATDLPSYRRLWEQNLGRDAYVWLRQKTAVIATLDDHEIDNDFNPETIAPARLAAGLQAFFENLPIRRSPEAPNRIWRSFRFGDTAEVFMLDCRTERRPSTRTSDAPIYISREQMDWLKAGLAASPCVFKLVGNSVPITDFPGLFDAAQSDRWEGYAAQRTELLSYVDDMGIGGVVWIAGDFHLASIGRVSPEGPGASALEALVGPGAQSSNPIWPMLRTSAQFDWVSGDENYTTLELDPVRRTVRFRYYAGDGSMIADRTYER